MLTNEQLTILEAYKLRYVQDGTSIQVYKPNGDLALITHKEGQLSAFIHGLWVASTLNGEKFFGFP